jgi:regulatory protein
VRRPRRPEGEAAAADEREVRTAALALLAGREFGHIELVRRLTRRGFPIGVVQAVVSGLAAERLLSEDRFLEQYVRQHAARGQGPVRIQAELRARGVAEADIESALDASGEDWAAVAREARRRRFGVSLPGDYRDRARQARFLQYRGFSADQIRAALGPADDTDP